MKHLIPLLCLMSLASAFAQTTEWSVPLEGPASAPTLFPDEKAPTGIIVTSGKDVMLIKGDGTVAWKSTQLENIATSGTAADLDGDGAVEVLLALGEGTVVCLDARGKERWRHAFSTPAGGFKVLAAADLTPDPGLEVLAGFDDGWLNCLNAKGELVWRFFGDRFRVGGFAVGDTDGDGAVNIIYGTDNGNIYCLDGWGRVAWRYSEFAPYGRSGPNIADLDRDKKPEVLITRSNVGNVTCLMALDAATGSFRWRTQDVMQGYLSTVVLDLDGDGKLEVLHGDKGNNLYCENADGSRRWRAELGGRGLFYAPCAADVDGDGQIEIVAGMRGTDPTSKGSVYVVGADGKIESALPLGAGANASPCVGDIDGDGQLEVIVATEGPNQIECLSWNAKGVVAWPSMRGNSHMTANSDVGVGLHSKPFKPKSSGNAQIETGDVVLGEGRWTASWEAPTPENAFIEVRVESKGSPPEARIVNLVAETTKAELPVVIPKPGAATVFVALRKSGETQPLFSVVRRVKPERADFCWFDRVKKACDKAVETGKLAGAATEGLRRQLAMLAAERTVVRSTNADVALASKATALRARAKQLESFAGRMEEFWKSGKAGGFVLWQDPNPWDPFDPAETPEPFHTGQPIVVKAFGNEFEDIALTLLNTSDEAFDVRCSFAEPRMDGRPPAQEPNLARNIQLRQALPVATTLQDRVLDALPELGASQTISLPPGEARQLWVVFDTHGLEPGAYELPLYLGSLAKPPTVRTVPLKLEVWPVKLEQGALRKINWCGVDLNTVSDQTVKDMIDHGMSVVYGPPLPVIPVDVQGKLTGTIDWALFDKTLERVPNYFTMLFSSPPPRQWPQGPTPSEDSDVYFAGFQTAIKALAEHLDSRGFPYEQWAFYPVDEPWNTGFTLVPQLRAFCSMVKRADPKAQNYTDPAGLVRVEYLDEFKDLIDIWQPEMNLLKRDPKLVDWFQKNAKQFWTYEAPGPAKDLSPLAHYRAFSWLAWKFRCVGSGYWVYRSEDNWWPVNPIDYSAVYPSPEGVVPSRRWEADRDGVEDYGALSLLMKEVVKAGVAGHLDEANRVVDWMNKMVEDLVGWQSRNIDEITRMTRDYELDFVKLSTYREQIAAEIVRMRGGTYK